MKVFAAFMFTLGTLGAANAVVEGFRISPALGTVTFIIFMAAYTAMLVKFMDPS